MTKSPEIVGSQMFRTSDHCVGEARFEPIGDSIFVLFWLSHIYDNIYFNAFNNETPPNNITSEVLG